MHRLSRLLSVLLLVWIPAACHGTAVAGGPTPQSPAAAPTVYDHQEQGLLLTWQRDPTTTMTIDWHTVGEASEPLFFRARGGASASGGWTAAPSIRRPFPFTDRTVHRAELAGLAPGGAYEFRIGESGPVRWFRTMPADASAPVRFVTGGDLRHRREWMVNTARQAMRYDPEFVLIGGDLAYADGREDRAYRWIEFFEVMMEDFVTDEGRVVPMIAGIGNHEVRGGRVFQIASFDDSDAWRERYAPYFYTFFAFPGHPGYGVLDVGDYLSMFVLDTDHSTTVEGHQTEWLQARLAERQGRAHLFPVYHVPAFPSVRPFVNGDGGIVDRVRANWVPLFERYGVRVAFENHDHAYKRTVPLREGRQASDGIVYIGDGAWGVGTREIGSQSPADEDKWYLDTAIAVRHFIVVTMHGPHQHFLVVDAAGGVIDEYPATFRVSPTLDEVDSR
jgi:acid phosphatase type 7